MHASPLVTLLIQVILILALSRILGYLFALIRQPQVIGEMVAGIMLGPSLLGLIHPQLFRELFPLGSVEHLHIVSQIGIIFFLFLIGLEFDPQLIRQRGRAAVSISLMSVALPFAIGVALTFWLYPRLFEDPERKHFLASALFMGAAISVTAFPVLARIITERNLHKTPVGALSIAAAAADDATAWMMLAFVVAVAQYDPRTGPWGAIGTGAMALIFVLFMLTAMRPFLARLQLVFERRGKLTLNLLAVIVLLVLASAYATERIGIHALFGAFLMGCVMPKGSRFVRELNEKMEDFTLVALLPLFFAYAGLNTDLTQIFAAQQWGYAGIIVLAACFGKMAGAAAAAKIYGHSWRESAAIGTLMNTRGLMELIILTIGLQLGVINDNVYSIMVIMALVTTAITTPLLQLIYPEDRFGPAALRTPADARKAYTVLIPVSDPISASPLLRMAALLAGVTNEQRKLIALHLIRPSTRDAYRAGLEKLEDPTLDPLMLQAAAEGTDVQPVSFVTHDVADDIATVARVHQANLVLMGFHKPVFGTAMLGGTVYRVIMAAPSDVAIYVDRGLKMPKRVLVPYMGSEHDRLALELAQRIARHAAANVRILHVVQPRRGTEQAVMGARTAVERVFQEPGQNSAVEFKVVEDSSPVDAVLRESASADLVIIGVTDQWGLGSHMFGFRPQRIAVECPKSLLIVRHLARTSIPRPAAAVTTSG